MSIELSSNPQDLRSAFYNLQTRQDIANLLEISEKQLIYYLYIIPEERRYKYFKIPKKLGGSREILAPASALKIIQQKLNQVLQSVYKVRPSVHGFIPGRSIVTNSLLHVRKRYVLNIDLKDFFPTINFGRVRGLFMAPPYNRNPEVATILAQICCYRGSLPQGAPTSPIVSNMICSKLDSQMQKLAKVHRSTYSRYADDISISTSRPVFPKGLGYFSNETGELIIGDELKTVITQNGFNINEQKNRLQHYSKRQEVTGLTVNIFPNVKRQYVREIRGMLHAWERYGYEAAESTFRTKYANKHPEHKREVISFKRVVEGKLNYLKMVKGESNIVYVNLLTWYWRLSPNSGKHEVHLPKILQKPIIFTEGKTDYKHLQVAFSKLLKLGFFKLDIQFEEYGDQRQMGYGELLKMCQTYCLRTNNQPNILIFDRDVHKILNDVTDEESGYKNWGNNVFSFAIPIPAHRVNNSDICIELYYQDKDIKRKDIYGRRLFLSDEFNEKNGLHKSLIGVYTRSNKINNINGVTIIDSQVFNSDTGESLALSKDGFAEYIKNSDPNFQNFDFSEFKKIFDVIIKILSEN